MVAQPLEELPEPRKMDHRLVAVRQKNKMASVGRKMENLSVCQIPVFRYGLLMRNRGYFEFETLEKQCGHI
jgi:hypothetical protein